MSQPQGNLLISELKLGTDRAIIEEDATEVWLKPRAMSWKSP